MDLCLWICTILFYGRLYPLWSCLVERVEIQLYEGGDVVQVAPISKCILIFAFANLNSILLIFISCIALIAHLYICNIVLTHILIQESYEAP